MYACIPIPSNKYGDYFYKHRRNTLINNKYFDRFLKSLTKNRLRGIAFLCGIYPGGCLVLRSGAEEARRRNGFSGFLKE
jgi:hypothetical protein